MEKRRLVIAISLILISISCSRNSQIKDATINTAETLVFSNPDSALMLLRNIDISKIAEPEDQARYSLLLTIAQDKTGIVHKSIDDINIALAYYEKASTPDSLLGVINYYLGRVYEDMGEPREALESYFKAKSYFENNNSCYWLGRIFYNMGYLYYYDGDYNHAASFLEKAIDQFSLCKDSLSVAHTYNLIGANYLLLGDHLQALAVLKKASDMYVGLDQTEGLLSTALAISSIYMEELGNVSLAESVLKQTHTKYNDGKTPLEHYPLLSQIEARKGNFYIAVQLLEEYVNSNVDLSLEQKSYYIYLISNYYRDMGNDKLAYNYVENYLAVLDSLHKNETVTVLREVEEKYKQQELENRYKSYRKQTAYRIIIGALIFCIIISLLILEVRKRKKRNLTLQTDLDGLRSQMNDFEDLKQRLSVVLNKKIEKETRLQEVLMNKMLHVQKLVDYLFLYENNSDEFKKKIRIAVVQAEKNEYFGELHEIVNEKFNGIVNYLKEIHPTLTDDELSLCCLICFGFTNTQISILFGYTNSNSIFNKRHKVRKKMGLWPNYDSLETYLIQLADELKRECT